MKKINRSKLYLSRETIRTLWGNALRDAVGGGAPATKPIVCTTTAIPTCPGCGTGFCGTIDCPPTHDCPQTHTCLC